MACREKIKKRFELNGEMTSMRKLPALSGVVPQSGMLWVGWHLSPHMLWNHWVPSVIETSH